MVEALSLPVVGIILTVLSLAFAFYRWVSTNRDQVNREIDELRKDFDAKCDREREQRISLERTFSAFQLIAAQTYVPAHMLKATEDRLVSAIEKLEAQMSNLGDRFDRYAEKDIR